MRVKSDSIGFDHSPLKSNWQSEQAVKSGEKEGGHMPKTVVFAVFGRGASRIFPKSIPILALQGHR